MKRRWLNGWPPGATLAKVNYLRVWRNLCELPEKVGPHSHLPTISQIATHLDCSEGAVRKLFATMCSVKKQRDYARRMVDLEQPLRVRDYLAAIATNAPDHEMQRLEMLAREKPVNGLPTRPGILIVPESVPPNALPRPMTEGQVKALVGVKIPLGLQRGNKVLLYALDSADLEGRFDITEGEVVMMSLGLWTYLLRSMPTLWKSLELISKPTGDEIEQARDLKA